MRYKDIKLIEDGRIVKGVNTTADVGPNEIKIQAAKFGNTVDKDGRPPTLSKKVKGKSTNVLFNLGLAEAYDPKHGHDTFGHVKKHKDDNDKEVWSVYNDNGKIVKTFYSEKSASEYAEKNHDALMKNSIKANEAKEIANTSKIYVDMDGVLADFFTAWGELMGVDDWRNIDKKHDINDALQKIRDTDNFWLNIPVTANAKKLLDLIKDVKGSYSICSSPLPGDKNSEPHKKQWIKKHLVSFPPEEIIITHNKPQYATQPDGTPNILIDDYGKNIQSWEAAGGVGFKHKDHKFERTAQNIKQHMQEPVEERSLSKGEEKKKEKYVKGMKKAKGDFKDRYGDDAEAVMYATATKMAKEAFVSGKYNQDQILEILENFADGKTSGKSRPGRVKRSGASCNGSVTELRQKAKNASGERAKMYHWCANMKAGRNK
jgi:hypothetical protein